MRAGTSTLPSAQTRPRSLRTRSTIMRFSARDLSSSRNAAARYASSAGGAARGAVPLIGFDSTVRARSTRRKRPGEELSTDTSPRRGGDASRVGEREQVDAALIVVEGDQAVAEHERGVGQRRAVHERAAAVGLEL